MFHGPQALCRLTASPRHSRSAISMQVFGMNSRSPSGEVDSGLIISKCLIGVSVRVEFSVLSSFCSINTAFAYIPRTKPEPTSLLRQLAYQELSPLPGPDSDPDGWKNLDPVTCRGYILPHHPVNIQCTVRDRIPSINHYIYAYR